MKVKYSLWRDFVMWVGVGCLLGCGLIVGKQYFNKVLDEIESEAKTITVKVR